MSIKASAPDTWRERVTTAPDAVTLIRPGDRVFVGTGCAVPLTLLRALEESADASAGVRLAHVVLSGELPEGYRRA